MHKLIALLLLSFLCLSVQVQAQKTVEVSDNRYDQGFYNNISSYLKMYHLRDLSQSKDSLCIRIWMSNRIIEISQQDGVNVHVVNHIYHHTGTVIKTNTYDSETARILLDTLLTNGIMNISPDAKFGIDGFLLKFEISTPDKYRVYSYWSPRLTSTGMHKKVAELSALTSRVLNLNNKSHQFRSSLESGGYPLGMSSFWVDRFLPDDIEKSSLYIAVQTMMKAELGVDETTSSLQFPRIMINNLPVFMRDLNKYDLSEIKKVKLIRKGDDLAVLYGAFIEHGLFMIETLPK
tara:strand:+ start:829 stop:1701 length:873 start_codon:yes stop_codon:yes gene_type:complete